MLSQELVCVRSGPSHYGATIWFDSREVTEVTLLVIDSTRQFDGLQRTCRPYKSRVKTRGCAPGLCSRPHLVCFWCGLLYGHAGDAAIPLSSRFLTLDTLCARVGWQVSFDYSRVSDSLCGVFARVLQVLRFTLRCLALIDGLG